MKKDRLKKVFAYVLTLCMAVTLLFGAKPGMVKAETEGAGTTVYFYNLDGWSEVGAHAWSNSDSGAVNLTGDWNSTKMTASDIGENWYELNIQSAPGFSVICFNPNADSQRTTVEISDAENVYITMNDKKYASKDAAEKAVKEEASGYIYFLNSGKWENVGVYVYGDKGEVLGGWGSTTAEPAAELGEDWYKVQVAELPPYSIIFYNVDADSERAELYLPSKEHIYVTNTAQSFTTKGEAEEAAQGTPTTIYFLNNDGEKTVYDEVYVYAYAGETPVAGNWPGMKAEAAPDLGENWYQVSIPRNASSEPFTIIVNNNDGAQQADINIVNYKDNYVTTEGLFTNKTDAEKSVGITYETVVYYLNCKGWTNVNAYIYGEQGEVFGGWPGTTADMAPEKGENWMKVVVPAPAPFNIIFFNNEGNDGVERAELLISNENMVYVAGSKEDGDVGAYSTQLAAELAMGIGDPSLMTTLYFYNYRNWDDINAYFFTKEDEDADGVELGGGWPGRAAEKDSETGEGWWKVSVPQNAEDAPFYAIFNDGVNQTEDIYIEEKERIYITPGGQKFASAAEAEAAAADEKIDDGCEEGPNADLDAYVVNYNGAGAALPYITYEAEQAKTNAKILEYATDYLSTTQSEASGRQAVKLSETGDYVTFTLTEPANSLVLRYSIPDSADGAGTDATLSLYLNGTVRTGKTSLDLTSRYAWIYGSYPYTNNVSQGKPHRFFDETRLLLDETLPAGATVTLQKDDGDTADYYIVDFVECELVVNPLEQPENSLSVTDYGAVADDGIDDYEAFVKCIEAAKAQDKVVWIPAGTFDLTEKKAIVADGVTIRGAGMWYTNLNGAGAAFKYQGTSKFYDFAMTGVSTIRKDSEDLAGFESNGARATNITIQNIWMEHIKVGVWSGNTDGMVIQGCRIRNTYADGINLCSGTKNTTVRNNSLRNTGDDCIAIWPWLADCSDNVIEHNTIQVPTLANGVAIYGGGNNVVKGNYVADAINNGAGIVVGSEFDIAKGYTGPITVQDNVLDRCGSMQTDENYRIGALWIWSSWHPMTTGYYVRDNQLNNCVNVGITIECNSELTGLELRGNRINGATDAIFEYHPEGSGKGSGTVDQMTDSVYSGKFDDDQAPDFVLTVVDDEETNVPEEPTPTPETPQEPSEPTPTPEAPTEPSEPTPTPEAPTEPSDPAATSTPEVPQEPSVPTPAPDDDSEEQLDIVSYGKTGVEPSNDIVIVDDGGNVIYSGIVELVVRTDSTEAENKIRNAIKKWNEIGVNENAKMKFYDVYLQTASEKSVTIKEGKLYLTFPYFDENITAEKGYIFTVLHLKADGKLEVLASTTSEDGIRVEATSLSPFAIVYTVAGNELISSPGTYDYSQPVSELSGDQNTGDMLQKQQSKTLWYVIAAAAVLALAAAATRILILSRKEK